MFWDEELESDLLSEVKVFIPQEYEQEILFDALRKYQKSLDLPTLMSDLKTVINGPERILLYEEIRPLIPLKQQMDYDSLCPVLPSDTLKVIRLRRYGNESLGFAVRGGLEHGIGMFVSQVSQQSQAYQKGLRKGDEIIRVNGFTISEAIHEEVLSLIKARNEIVLKIRRIGMLPVKSEPHENIRWEDVPKESIYSMSNGSNLGKIVKLFINMSGSTGLGCRIASGPSSHPGIFIQFVKKGGLAEEAGLEVGDQIIHVNETSFLNVSHSQAVVALKSSKHLEVTIRKGIGLSLTDSAANDSVSTNAPTAHTETSTSTSSYTNPVTPKEEDIVFNQLERRTERRIAPRPPTDQPTKVNGHFQETTPEASSYEEDASRLELKTSSNIEDSQNENFVLKKQPAPLAPHVPNRQKNRYGSMCEDLTDMEARRLFSVDQIARRQIRLIKIRMNGPLGIEVEGGLNSPLAGRINVAAIFDGAAARQGGIHVGDQLMMADNIKLIDVPLIQAENVLDLAEKRTGELVKFIIAVAPPKYYEEEATYF